MELKLKAGKNKQVDVEVYKKEVGDGNGFKKVKLFAKVQNVEEELKLVEKADFKAIMFYNEDKNLFGKKTFVYIIVSEEDFEKLKELEEKVKKENKERYENFLRNIKLKFVVKKESLKFFDTYYDLKVLVANRDLLKDERERYERVLEALKLFNKSKIQRDDYLKEYYIDAREFEEGSEFGLEQIEEMFKEEINKFEKFKKEQALEKERAEKEYQRKKLEAIEKAKKTKKEVIIRKVDGYESDRDGWVNVYEVATPDGEVVEKAYPSY